MRNEQESEDGKTIREEGFVMEHHENMTLMTLMNSISPLLALPMLPLSDKSSFSIRR
jgi:hypothetical protein